jgi:myo-inositol-1(or 4)-monophosphatase
MNLSILIKLGKIKMEHDIKTLTYTCIKAVEIAYSTVHDLGRTGIAKVAIPGKDLVTKADLKVSDNWREYFTKNSIPLVVLTEESRNIPFEARENARYLGIGDEIDGTSNHNRCKELLPSCAIFTIFDNLDPCFDDALVTAIKNHITGDLWYAIKGQGCYFNNTRVKTSDKKEFGNETSVIIDEGYCPDPVKSSLRFFKINQGVWRKNISSAGIHLAGVSSGSYAGWDGFISLGQKSEELASGYLLIKEARGYLIDSSGNDIGNQKILPLFNQGKTLEIIAAGTKELGDLLKDNLLNIEQTEEMYNRIKKII